MTCFRLKSGQTLRSACKEAGINYTTIYTRCDQLGMSPDEAISTGPLKQKNIHYINGYSLKAACMYSDISYQVVIDVMRYYKLPVERAFEKVLHKKPLTKKQESAIKLFGGIIK